VSFPVIWTDPVGVVDCKFCDMLKNPWDPWDWYIYLHLDDFYGECIGKYTICGSYAYFNFEMDGIESLPQRDVIGYTNYLYPFWGRFSV